MGVYVPVEVGEDGLRDFLRRAYQEVEAVRQLLDGLGLTPSGSEPPGELLRRLPVTSKQRLREQQRERPPFGGWVREDGRGVARLFVSPGPIYNVEDHRPDDWGAAEALRAAGFGPGDLVINTFSYHLSPASFIVESGLRELGATVIPAGTGSRAERAQLLRDLPVTAFTGLPSYLSALLEELEASGEGVAGARPALTLRRAWFTAEPLSETLRQHLAERWGVEAFQGYGTAEVGIVAFECERHEGMHLGRQAVVEILDPATGEPVPEGAVGEVVVTALRRAYPLLRLGTGDLSRLLLEPCPCGRPSPRLAGVLGRVGSGVKVRGMFVYPHQVDDLARRVPGVARLAARVQREGLRDRLTLEVEPTGSGAPRGLEEAVAQAARELLRVRPDAVRVVAPGSLQGRPTLVDVRDGGSLPATPAGPPQ